MTPSPKPIRILALAALLTASIWTSPAADTKPFELKTKPYPLGTCVISGEDLGSMGAPFVFTEGNQEVQLCCKPCQKDFLSDKAANLQKIEEAARKVKPYPSTTCITSDEPLDAERTVGVVHEGREFRFCCKGCIREFRKEPAKFVKKFDAAAAKKKS